MEVLGGILMVTLMLAGIVLWGIKLADVKTRAERIQYEIYLIEEMVLNKQFISLDEIERFDRLELDHLSISLFKAKYGLSGDNKSKT